MTITLQTINSASIKELKAFANDNDIFIQGDKRRKDTWIESITDFLIESGEMESIADEADINNGTAAVTTFTQIEPFTCAYPTQQVSDFIDLANYAYSPTQTLGLEPVVSELSNEPSKVNELVEDPLGSRQTDSVAFNQSTSAILPMKLVLWTLAITIIPAVIVLGWFGNGVIKLVRATITLMDRAITRLLEGTVWVTELLFGDSFDQHSDSYLEIKHLLRN